MFPPVCTMGMPYGNPTASYLSVVNGLDMASGLYSGVNSLSGFDGDLGSQSLCSPTSIFGSIMSGAFGYGPGSEIMHMTQEDYLKYSNRMTKLQMGQQVDLKKTNDALRVYADAEEDEIARDSGNLQRLIKENRQDQIVPAYQKLQTAVSKKLEDAGYDISTHPEQVKAVADKAYYEATHSNLIDDIQAHGKSSFFYGFLRGTGIGCAFTDKNDNRDETLSKVTGVERSSASKSWEVIGKVAGTIATVFTLGFTAFALGKGKGLKFKP